MFKKGDQVQIVVEDSHQRELLEEWCLQGYEGEIGIVDEGGDNPYVLFSGLVWYVPNELLIKIRDENITEQPVTGNTLQRITTFTEENPGYEVSFEKGRIVVTDWTNDPNMKIYRPKTLDELEELMVLFERLNEFWDNGEG